MCLSISEEDFSCLSILVWCLTESKWSAEASCPESVPSDIAPARPSCPPPLYHSAAETSSLKPETPGQAIFAQLSSFTTHPFGEGMKARSLPPAQNISNFHLSSLRITCLTRAGVQAVLICPFARTLCKQSASYLLCVCGGKNDLIALAGHVIGHPFILLTINYICNQRDSTFSTSKTLLSKAIGMHSVHHACPESMNF